MSPARVASVELWRLDARLVEPYSVARYTFYSFDPLVGRVELADGTQAWGEAVITAGYAEESAEEGGLFLASIASRLPGLSPEAALEELSRHAANHPHACSILAAPLEALAGVKCVLPPPEPARMSLLAPVQGKTDDALDEEIESLIAAGYRTLKVKVGFSASKDLARVRRIQRQVNGRAVLRLDANQAFDPDEGRAFARALDPQGIELFEQPCAKDDWDANATVAAVSAVPVMLDESIYGMHDIARAASIKGVGFVKLKMKKCGSPSALAAGIREIQERGLTAVVGDGTATDIGCFYEARIAAGLCTNAGEMNGFLKLARPLFVTPLQVNQATLLLPQAIPAVDGDEVRRQSMGYVAFGAVAGRTR